MAEWSKAPDSRFYLPITTRVIEGKKEKKVRKNKRTGFGYIWVLLDPLH